MMAPRKRRICSLGRIDFRVRLRSPGTFFCFKIKKKLKDRDESLERKIERKRKKVEGLFGKNFLSPSLFLSLSDTPTCTHTLPLSLILTLTHAHPHTTKCVHARAHSLSFRSGTQDGNTNRL